MPTNGRYAEPRGMGRVDRNMNRDYQQLLSELGFLGRARLRASQRERLAERRAYGSNPTCVRLAYRERVGRLHSIARRRGVALPRLVACIGARTRAQALRR